MSNVTDGTHYIPPFELGSILARSPVSPLRRVQAAILLCPRLERPTLPALAQAVGVTRQHLLAVLTGQRSSDPLWARVAGFLGVGVADLRDGGPGPLVGDGQELRLVSNAS